jgi:decaprenyl-phosphate phosphoribosyltransferase
MQKVALVDFDKTLIGSDSLYFIFKKERFYLKPKLLFSGLTAVLSLGLPKSYQIPFRSRFKKGLLEELKTLSKKRMAEYIQVFRTQLDKKIIGQVKAEQCEKVIVISGSEETIIRNTLSGMMVFDLIIANSMEKGSGGGFKTCWGQEKLERLKKELGDLKNYEFVLFTDSDDDRPLKEISSKVYDGAQTMGIRKGSANDSLSFFKRVTDFVQIFRPLRLYRNLIILLGVIFAVRVHGLDVVSNLQPVGIAFLCTCCIAFGNYGINEVLDAKTDAFHPVKKFRALPSGKVKPAYVIVGSVLFYVIGLALISTLNRPLLLLALFLLFASGLLYNIKPFRFKDLPYLDFSFEALNSPIRFLIGWYAVAPPLSVIPSSFFLMLWFIGIFLMCAKRFGELRFIKDKSDAGNYRKSLKYYSEERLLAVMTVAFGACNYMIGALTFKYDPNLILMFPLLLAWGFIFILISYEENSVVKDPERIFEKKAFLLFNLVCIMLFIYLIFSNDLGARAILGI